MIRYAHRDFKDRLYGLFARIGKALSSPNRLEILELLAQGERTVDSLATEIGQSLANTSQHLQALRQAAVRVKNYRLPGTTLYVTMEPCVMCAGAIVLARVNRLVFATRDLRFGGVRSKFALADSDLLNHRVEVEEGLLAADAAQLLDRFFRERRKAAESSGK